MENQGGSAEPASGTASSVPADAVKFRALVDSTTEADEIVSMVQRSSSSQQALLLSELVKQVRQFGTIAQFFRSVALFSWSSTQVVRSKIYEAFVELVVDLFASSAAALYVVDRPTGQLRLEAARGTEGVDFEGSRGGLLEKCAASGKTCAGRENSASGPSRAEMCIPVIAEGVCAVVRVVRSPKEGSVEQDDNSLFHGPDQQVLESIVRQMGFLFQEPSPTSGGDGAAAGADAMAAAEPEVPVGVKMDVALKQALTKWDYNVWDYESGDIQSHIFIMYDLIGVIDLFSIDKSKLQRFIGLVASG